MSELTERYAKSKLQKKPEQGENTPEERRAIMTLRAEAKKKGATLASGGKGGLPPQTVLSVFRRDDYHCKVCGGKDNLSVHHKGGIPESKWLSKKGHKLDLNNLVVVCTKCHDKLHNQAREEGVDSSQVLPEGDEGEKRRDHGQPPANPPEKVDPRR